MKRVSGSWISISEAERMERDECRRGRNIAAAIVAVLLAGYGALWIIEFYSGAW